MEPYKRNRLIFVGALVGLVVVIFIGVALSVWQKKTASTSSSIGSANNSKYYDPASKQTVDDPPGKAPETYGADPSAPIFLGDTSLLDYGVTSDQLDSTRQALQTYSYKITGDHNEVSIGVDSITHSRINSGTENMRDVLTFDVTFKRTTKLHAKLEYFDISNIELFLYNDSNTQLYDSGII